MRILVAEDEREMQRVLTVILEKDGYDVTVAGNGQEALQKLKTESYDAAILDILMPLVDGLTIVRQIRADGNHIPILLLSARNSVDDRVLGLDTGADDYLGKPFSSKELLARLRTITRRQQEAEQSDRIIWSDLVLDRTSCRLRCNSSEARLTEKEYRLMELFISQPGYVISIDQILNKIWGYDFESDSNVIWTAISRLRKTLERIGSKAVIRANRGLGYSLEYPDEKIY